MLGCELMVVGSLEKFSPFSYGVAMATGRKGERGERGGGGKCPEAEVDHGMVCTSAVVAPGGVRPTLSLPALQQSRVLDEQWSPRQGRTGQGRDQTSQ